jgi:DNA-binding response OmpR family regulator
MWGSSADGKPVVLLVEDDEDLLEMTTHMLGQRGCTVLTAANAVDAVLILRTREGPIDVLVTDLRLPGVSGGELARSAVALRPGLDVIYISGIPHEIALKLNLLRAGGNFLAKPFSAERLAAQVSTTLSARDK